VAIVGAKLQGAGRIIALVTRPACVEAAHFYGATDIVNYKTGDIAKQIMDLTNGKGVDRVILAGGTTETLIQAVSIVKPGGVVSNVNYHGKGDFLPIPREE